MPESKTRKPSNSAWYFSRLGASALPASLPSLATPMNILSRNGDSVLRDVYILTYDIIPLE